MAVAGDLLKDKTLPELEQLLDEAARRLPPEAHRAIAELEGRFGVERTQSRAAEERRRRNLGLQHPMKGWPLLQEVLRHPEAHIPDATTGVSVAMWFDWLLDSHLICREPYPAPEWVAHRAAIQRAASTTTLEDTVLYRGDAMASHQIMQRFPPGGLFILPSLTSTTPCSYWANYYGVSKAFDAAKWEASISQPVVLTFRNPRGINGVAIPERCAPAPFEERILPRGATYRVDTVDRDGAIVRIGLTQKGPA